MKFEDQSYGPRVEVAMACAKCGSLLDDGNPVKVSGDPESPTSFGYHPHARRLRDDDLFGSHTTQV